MDKKAEVVLSNKKTFTPMMQERKKNPKVIDITFTPLICHELYRTWINNEVKVRDFYQAYSDAKKDFVKLASGKKADSVELKNKEEAYVQASTEYQDCIDTSKETLLKFVTIVIENNDNPEEYFTREWIISHFTEEDLGAFVRASLSASDDETKKNFRNKDKL